MPASVTQGAPQPADVGTRIIRAMQRMGIAAIPRNYALIYEAYTGTDAALTCAVNELERNPSQDELDRIGEEHVAQHQGGAAVQRAHQDIARELEGLLNLLQREKSSLESYNRILGETYSRISEKSAASADILRSAIHVLSDATGTTMAEGREIAHSVSQSSSEMERVKLELNEYKRMANTDPLTRLANRRAFDEVLARIYSPGGQKAKTALLIADIDHFKHVNDTYGHPVGDRVLSILGNVMRANLRSDVFIARTGGEEFAVVMQDIDQEVIMKIAERLRLAIEATPLRNLKTGTNYGPITISIGICMAEEAGNADDLYRKGDIALYVAKQGGRNRIQSYYDGMEEDSLSDKLLYRRGIA
jgi:diguanylate cyclase